MDETCWRTNKLFHLISSEELHNWTLVLVFKLKTISLWTALYQSRWFFMQTRIGIQNLDELEDEWPSKGTRRKNISSERRPFFCIMAFVRYNYPIREISVRISIVKKRDRSSPSSWLRKPFGSSSSSAGLLRVRQVEAVYRYRAGRHQNSSWISHEKQT